MKSHEINQQKEASHQKEKIKYVVLSGGGAKGAAYSKLPAAFEEAGIWPEIEAVAGSSAGAMSAAFMATGIKPEKFEILSSETNFKSLLGKEGISWPIPLGKDATPLYKLMQQTIAENICDFFENNKDINALYEKRTLDIAVKQSELTKNYNDLAKELNHLKGPLADKNILKKTEKLEENIASIKDELSQLEYSSKELKKIQEDPSIIAKLHERAVANDKICFKDLGLLRALDPITFKDLLVTAVRKDNGNIRIFSSEQTPDIEIAAAVRASVAIPLVIKSKKVDGVDYVDGGYRNNIPLKYFASNKENSAEELLKTRHKIADPEQAGRTLAFAFGSSMDDQANVAIYSGKNITSGYKGIVKFLVDIIYKMLAKIGGQFRTSEDDRKTYEDLRKNATNSVVLDTGDVGTLSFDKAQQKSKYLGIKGELATLNHINNWDLSAKSLKGLAERSFLLEVYEKIDNKHPKISEKYLKFCEAGEWKDKDNNTQKLAEYAKLAQHDKGVSKILLDELNKPTTPNKIKKEFIEICHLKYLKLDSKALANFKFIPEHLSDGLDNKQKMKTVNTKTKDGKDTTALKEAANVMKKLTKGLVKISESVTNSTKTGIQSTKKATCTLYK